MKHLVARYRTSESGATALEFAFVLPVFLLLFFGILEYAIVLHLRGTIEEVTRETARQAITGRNPDPMNGETRQDNLTTMLTDAIGNVVYKPENVNISSTSWASYDLAGRTDSTPGTPAFGGANEIMRYTVQYQHEFLTPLPGFINGFESSLLIQSTAFAQNEDF
tara:strand:+ start:177 stop:671 length:495 start_codon:yes stop_codon:yes gene_type:complete